MEKLYGKGGQVHVGVWLNRIGDHPNERRPKSLATYTHRILTRLSKSALLLKTSKIRFNNTIESGLVGSQEGPSHLF